MGDNLRAATSPTLPSLDFLVAKTLPKLGLVEIISRRVGSQLLASVIWVRDAPRFSSQTRVSTGVHARVLVCPSSNHSPRSHASRPPDRIPTPTQGLEQIGSERRKRDDGGDQEPEFSNDSAAIPITTIAPTIASVFQLTSRCAGCGA